MAESSLRCLNLAGNLGRSCFVLCSQFASVWTRQVGGLAGFLERQAGSTRGLRHESVNGYTIALAESRPSRWCAGYARQGPTYLLTVITTAPCGIRSAHVAIQVSCATRRRDCKVRNDKSMLFASFLRLRIAGARRISGSVALGYEWQFPHAAMVCLRFYHRCVRNLPRPRSQWQYNVIYW